jgi:putative serine protease PepD
MSDETTQIIEPANPTAAGSDESDAPATPATPPATQPPPGPASPPTPAGPGPATPNPPAPPTGPPTLPPAAAAVPAAGAGGAGTGDVGTGGATPPPASPPSPPHTPAPPTPPGRGRRAVAVLAAAGLMLVSATGGAAVALALDDDGSPPAGSSLDTPLTADRTAQSEPDEALSQAAAAVLPSVVSIGFENRGAEGSGSGVILSEDGQILTNNHVVAPAADSGSLTVTFADGSTADAEILGRDPATDLAVIQAQDVSGLTPATFGSSEDLNVGDTVLAVGSPLGLDGSVTSGIVSARDRSITLQEDEVPSPFGGQGSGGTTAVIDAIQTDAAINPGNSGGALTDADGNVVGINTAIASLAQGTTSQGGNIGVGFAIPIDSARDIAQQLIENGEATHAFLGVSIADTEDGDGALVGAVEANGPADEAGLQEGDVITQVGDNDVTDASELTAAVRANQPGDQVQVTYVRDGDEHTADVTLGELSTD